MVGAGALLEIMLGLEQVGTLRLEPALEVAAAFAIVVGIQSLFSSFVVYLLISEYSRLNPSA